LTLQRIFILLLTSCLSPVATMAQFDVGSSDEQYYSDDFIRFENHTYRDDVQTVLLHPKGWPIAAPFIDLNEPESVLELNFDVLDAEMGNFMYKIIHCDHDWKQSALDVQEYIDGMPEDFLTDYAYSGNTFQRYIHYHLEIPNFNMQLTKSGNYILLVYDSDTEEPVLTRRFCVSENLVTVAVKVRQASRVNQRYSHQEVDFSIRTDRYDMTNPYQDLYVVIMQNHSWEKTLTGLEPRFVKQDELDYDYDGPNAMEGGNEFRMMNITNPRFNGPGVERVTFDNQENHAYLELDKSRASKAYLQNPDLNGWFYIRNDLFQGREHTDADYVRTHFRLQKERPLVDGDVYIYGALTNWRIVPEAKMKFNQLELQYENTLYLKQGIYNYQYVFVKDGQLQPDLTRFEGSHFQTENEYSILVYHRGLGLDYYRLLNVTTVNYPPQN
jgi:hypothetical protein